MDNDVVNRSAEECGVDDIVVEGHRATAILLVAATATLRNKRSESMTTHHQDSCRLFQCYTQAPCRAWQQQYSSSAVLHYCLSVRGSKIHRLCEPNVKISCVLVPTSRAAALRGVPKSSQACIEEKEN